MADNQVAQQMFNAACQVGIAAIEARASNRRNDLAMEEQMQARNASLVSCDALISDIGVRLARIGLTNDSQHAQEHLPEPASIPRVNIPSTDATAAAFSRAHDASIWHGRWRQATDLAWSTGKECHRLETEISAARDRITALEADLQLARDLVMQMTTRVQQWQAAAEMWRAQALGTQHKAAAVAAPAPPQETPPIFRAIAQRRPTIGLLTEKP